jgi:hypothetical protein
MQGHWSWLVFKHPPYDYTKDKLNLPQGHEDLVRMADLLPADRAHCKEDDDNSILPSDWLEGTGELHTVLDCSFGPGTYQSLSIGDLLIQYGNFYTGCTGHF